MQENSARKLVHTQRQGAILVFAAIILFIVAAFLAMSVDWGYIAVSQSELQNAADAGALAGARQLPNRTAVIAAAQLWASKNKVSKSTLSFNAAQDIELGTWNESNASFTVVPSNSSIVANAVRVKCNRLASRGNALTLFFGPMIGTNSSDISVSAIAQNKGGACGGIMALEKIYLNDRQVGRASYTDSYDSSKGDYNSLTAGKNGDICTNGHLTLNSNSKVNGDARWLQGAKAPNAEEDQVTGEFASFTPAIEFPAIDPGSTATINLNSTLPPSAKGRAVLSGTKFKLGDVTVSGGFTIGLKTGTPDSITFAPGTYYFTEMALGSNSKITITGPTYIYVNGQIDMRWGNIDNTTKSPINLQIYPMGLDTYFYLPFFGTMYASIYSTVAHIYLDDKAQPVTFSFFGKMVGQKIRVWDTALHVDESITFGALRSGGNQIGKSGLTLVK